MLPFCRQGLFDDVHYFLKPILPYSEDRENFERVPSWESGQLPEFLRRYQSKITEDSPYFLNQFIRGQEYACNLICNRGKITAFQVSAYKHLCFSDSFQPKESTLERDYFALELLRFVAGNAEGENVDCFKSCY